MAANSNNLEYWRNFFSSANSDIFDVIEYAIVVAASDWPKEFRLRRDRIAETLFSCRLTRCLGCDRIEVAVPEAEEDDGFKGEFSEDGRCQDAGSAAKESKVNSSSNDQGMDMNQFSNYSYTEAEALTEEIEEKNQTVDEVLRIRDVLNNYQDESDAVLFESLRRLQLMQLSVGTLKMTEIGKAVNVLRKHESKQIRHLVRTLIVEWKNMVDEWVSASAAIAGNSPDSVNPSAIDDEEGLPSPPLDEGAFLVTQTTSMELSQFFDGMDDDGNIQCLEELKQMDCSLKTPSPGEHHPGRKLQKQLDDVTHEENQFLVRNHHQFNKQAKSLNADAGPGRPLKPASQNKPNGVGVKSGQPSGLTKQEKKQPLNQERSEVKHKVNGSMGKFGQHMDLEKLDRKSQSGLPEKSKFSDEMSVRVKLEASKRKLHERYQQAENAKKQRTIQVMELHDLPKQSLGSRNFHPKFGNHNRHFSGGRR